SNSTFVGNLATGGTGATGNGGALDVEGTGATMTVSNSWLLGNQSVGAPGGDGLTTLSQGLGGGGCNFFGTLTVRHSAPIGNRAVGGSGGSNVPAGVSDGVGGGGGIENALGAATVTGCTFAGNQAVGGASAAGLGGIGQGGGIVNTFGAGLTVSDSTFVA